jgi:hypothetical protein
MGKGLTSGEKLNQVYTVSFLADKGSKTVSLNSTTGLAIDQLMAYLGTDGRYYSFVITEITSNSIVFALPLESSLSPGTNVYSFYFN